MLRSALFFALIAVASATLSCQPYSVAAGSVVCTTSAFTGTVCYTGIADSFVISIYTGLSLDTVGLTNVCKALGGTGPNLSWFTGGSTRCPAAPTCISGCGTTTTTTATVTTTTVATTTAATTAPLNTCCAQINTAITNVCTGATTTVNSSLSTLTPNFANINSVINAYGSSSSASYRSISLGCSEAAGCSALPSGFTGASSSVVASAMSVLLALIFALALLF